MIQQGGPNLGTHLPRRFGQSDSCPLREVLRLLRAITALSRSLDRPIQAETKRVGSAVGVSVAGSGAETWVWASGSSDHAALSDREPRSCSIEIRVKVERHHS